ncbi:MAG: TonB-dependent receptor [Polaromonas sp.]|nr:TonB-dependent receptor [Polaromonas sp.]
MTSDHLRPHGATPARTLAPLQRRIRQTAFAAALAATGLVTSGLLASPAWAQAEAAAYDISLPAQPLSQALAALSRQTGVQVLAAGDVVANRTAPAVSGRLTARQALERLIAGGGLQVRSAGQTLTVERAAAGAGGQTLSTVTVTAGANLPDVLPPAYAGGQLARGGRAGVLGNADFMDSPFAITSLTEEFRQNIQAKSIADVLKYTPSVQTPQLGLGAQNDAVNLRGFPTNSGAGTFNGLGGLLSRQAPLEPFERIELLLGSSAFANGRVANVGGTTNLVPKRAGEEPLTRVGTEFISEGNFGVNADIARRFGTDNAWGIRVNASHADGDAAVEHSERRATTGSVGLDWRGERLRWSFDYIHNRRDQSPGLTPYIGLGAGQQVPRAPDAGKLFITPGASTYERKLDLGVTRLDYALNDNWDLSAAHGFSKDEDGPTEYFGFYTLVNQAGDMTVNRFISMRGKYENQSGELMVRGRLNTGGVTHKVTAGVSRFAGEGKSIRSTTFLPVPVTTNLYNPVNIPRPNVASAVLPAHNTYDETTTGLFLSDEIGFFNDRLLVTLGVRDTTIESNSYSGVTGALVPGTDYKTSSLTPAIGVVGKVLPWLSVYGNAVEALESGGVVNGAVLSPYRSKQLEGGLKADFGTVAATLGVFQIERATGYNQGGVFVRDGRQENTGVELSVFGEVQRGLRLYGGLSVIDAKLKRTSVAANNGNTAPDVPDYALGATVDWDVPGVPGLALLGGFTRNGKQYHANDNVVTVPAWTRFDAGVRYTTRIQGKPTVFRFNVDNLADRNYFFSDRGDLNLAPPRTFYLSATVDF